MDISVTRFTHRCLELVRRVEASGTRVTITRLGRVVARLEPAHDLGDDTTRRPWERLRALGGRLRGKAGDFVLRDEDFEALR